jgi:protein-disulfide isomerase
MEAKSRGTSTESVLADIKVRAVTDAEEKAFYEANRAQTSKSFDEVKPEITQLLASKHDTEAVRSFHDELRARYHLVSLLEPYRLEVPGTAVGPARGSDKAPVTIVEFGDFQCPYCRQAEDTLKVVMGMHPDDVRLVFRELPLAKIHPHALEAARAAVCADRQGQFWSMHDAMYQDQTALDEAALKQTAKRIGLDGEKFAACLRDDATAQQILGDVRTADELAITGTPFFLINGRPINGNVPVDQFEAVLLEELKRAGAKRG